MNNFTKELCKYKTSKWDLANSIIYDMCQKYHTHTDEREIIAKIWIIGRTYAAAIERRKNKKDNDMSSEDFYFDQVAPIFRKNDNGKKLDEKIDLLKNQSVTPDNIEEIILLHGFLVKLFSEITQLNKRSLASKYLHFHLPKLFYIYDSRAKEACNKTIKDNGIEYRTLLKQTKNNLDKITNEFSLDCYYDKEYLDFYIKNYCIQRNVEDEELLLNFPRIIDNYYLKI